MTKTALGLGGNLEKPLVFFRSAVQALEDRDITVISHSCIYRSDALMPENAPEEWNKDFLNMAILVEADLAPLALLAAMKEIEAALGRQKIGHWSPRVIDIDILAMENEIVDVPELQVPHRELLNRPFALLPLADIWPDWKHPNGHTVLEIASRWRKPYLFNTEVTNLRL